MSRFKVVPRVSRMIGSLMLAVFVTAAVVAVASTGTKSSGVVFDEETVYVTMDSQGNARDTIVIDWLRVEGDGEITVVDHGEVTEVEAIKDDVQPTVTGEDISWTLDVDGRRDFFYRATTDIELPVEVAVTYTLDGREVMPEEVAGASGHLRIDVELTNKLAITEDVAYTDANGVSSTEEVEYWMPLLAPVMIDVDGTKFSNIEGEAEIVSVTGSTVSHTFMAFPQPKATVTIEMDGEDIEIDPITVSVFPKLAGAPDFSTIDQFEDLRTGLDGLVQLSEGHMEIVGGIADNMDPSQFDDIAGVGEMFEELIAGVAQMADGADGLVLLVDGQIAYLDGVIAGLEGQDLTPIAALPSALETITASIQTVQGGMDGMVTLLDSQIAYLDGLAASNSYLESIANSHPDVSTDTTIGILASGLTTQTAMISTLRDGGDTPGGYMPGLTYTRDQLGALSAGLADIASAMTTITTESKALESLPAQFDQIVASLTVLRNGGDAMGQYLPGLVTTREGIAGLAEGLTGLESGLVENADQLSLLEELPAQLEELNATLLALRNGGEVQGMYLPGISTTADALSEMSAGLVEGIDQGRLGEEVFGRMEEAASEYDTFLGKPDDAEGDVRFVFMLDGISID